MYDLRPIRRFAHLCALGCAAALSLYHVQVNAAEIVAGLPLPIKVGSFETPSGARINQYTPAITGGASPVQATLSAGSGGDVRISAPSTYSPAKGAPVPVSVATTLPKVEAAKAIGRAALAILTPVSQIATVFIAGKAIYDLAQEMGLQPHLDSAGKPAIMVERQSIVCGPPSKCFEYQPSINGNAIGGWGTKANACATIVNFYQSNSNVATSCTWYSNGPDYPEDLIVRETSNGWVTAASARNREVPQSTGGMLVEKPITDMTAEVQIKENLVNSETYRKAVAEGINSLDSGVSLPTTGTTVSGPASSPAGAPVTSTNTTNGTTTTTTSTNNYTYEGDKITNNVSTVTTTINNTTGQVTNTTTETKPDEPKDDEPKDEYDVPEGEIPKSSRTVEFTPADLGFGGGSCPANVTQNINGQQVTIVNWVKSCDYITQYVKPLMLTLATFAAMVIIFLGGKTE